MPPPTDQSYISQAQAKVFELRTLPSEAEAYQLVKTTMFYIGYIQNLFDAREISDKISLFYAKNQESSLVNHMSTLELLLIFAAARLLGGGDGSEAQNTERFPGYTLFDFVSQHLPSLTHLYSSGRVGVEVTALMAVYLVNIDQKEEAYLYVRAYMSTAGGMQ